jgi:sulfoxide reductase catalytic subunit YedY
MLFRQKKSWELKESTVTPESTFLNRRQILAAAGIGAGAIAGSGFLPKLSWAADEDPSTSLYPVANNSSYTAGADRVLTAEDTATTYTNYYEFGSSKNIWRKAQKLPIRPWSVVIDGLVENEQTLDIDSLLAEAPLEERIYRHRCVEAWSMVVPWSGFSLAWLIKKAQPLSGAKYVRFETFSDKKNAVGQKQTWYPWPYVEGLTIDEAINELPFLVTGIYGKPLPKQNGAPLRLALPWKYGFKSIKGIVRITLTDEKPVSFWEEINASEYGFWANVNPEIPHKRWSQATERDIGTDKRIPTQLFNGYGEQVAHLYEGMKGKRLWS